MPVNQPEILAPAGGPQALAAAVLCGADSVYLGAGAFNARRNAENFTMENLAETVRYCHIRGVRVYLTLNIVLLENEIPRFLAAAQAACEAGVDAVIVQDLGAARLLQRHCPALRMHASTQMAVHNPDGVRMLEDLGFRRVVLARECSKDEIARIAAATPLEIELFVHGALCMCVSGQCYMSSVLGQRSGNRGLCAQPCRLAFSSSAREYALSLKDMSLISRMDEVRALGVHSLKIEGRMKRPEYVAAAVTACRSALAGEAVDLNALQAVFSRGGFTDGYFTGKRTIDMFGVRGKEDVTAAAGVLKQLENRYTDPRKQVQKVGVEFAFAMKPGQKAFLSAYDCDGNSVCTEGPVPENAVNKPTDEARVKASLEKTGGTPYHVENVRCSISPGLMLPVSALNAMRRESLTQLDETRGTLRPIPWQAAGREAPAPRISARRPALRARLTAMAQLTPSIRKRAALITLPAPELLKLCESGAEDCMDRLCAGVPRIQFSGQEETKAQLAKLWEYGVRHAEVGNLGAIGLVSGMGFALHGEAFLNAANSEAVQALAGMGLRDLTLSFELSLAAAKHLPEEIPCGVAAYGFLPLMTVRNCPVRLSAGCARCKKGEAALTDRKGNKLRTTCAYGCSEILNPVPLYMGDRLEELSGFDFVSLQFTVESPEECEQIFLDYENGGEPRGAFTRGLLYKTIL